MCSFDKYTLYIEHIISYSFIIVVEQTAGNLGLCTEPGNKSDNRDFLFFSISSSFLFFFSF